MASTLDHDGSRRFDNLDEALRWIGHIPGDWVRLPDGMIAFARRIVRTWNAMEQREDLALAYEVPGGYELNPDWRAEQFVRTTTPADWPKRTPPEWQEYLAKRKG